MGDITRLTPYLNLPLTTEDRFQMTSIWQRFFTEFVSDAAVFPVSSGVLVYNGADAISRTITAGSNNITVADGSGVDGNPTIDLSSSVSMATLTVSGNIIITGTVDGRDIATDGTKLDGIETAATGDQTDEEIQDAAWDVLTGTQTGITVTYQDSTNDVDFVVSDTTVAGDSGSTGITPGDTLTIAGGANTTTAMSGDTLTIAVPARSESVTVFNPSSSEDISIFFTKDAVTITEIRAVLLGSSTPSVTWTIRHGTDRSAAGAEVVTGGTTTTSITSGSDVTSLNDGTVVADSFVWLETTAQSGTVTELLVTIIYDVDT